MFVSLCRHMREGGTYLCHPQVSSAHVCSSPSEGLTSLSFAKDTPLFPKFMSGIHLCAVPKPDGLRCPP